MNKKNIPIYLTAAVFVLGVILAWISMIHALRLTDRIRPLGILAGLIGYGLIVLSVFMHEVRKRR